MGMNCWCCGADLIWGGDHDINEDSSLSEDYLIETNLSCPKCNAFVVVYHPKEKDKTPT